MAKKQKKAKPARAKAAAKKPRKVVKLSSKKANGAKKASGNGKSAITCRGPSTKPYGQDGKALDRRAHPRFHARAVRPDLHAAAGLARRRRDQGRAPRRRRHHARTVARRAKGADSLYFTMLNHNKRSITIDSQASAGQARARRADQELRRAGGEFRARRARPHGADLGAHPQAQPAHDRRLGQGLRPRPLRGLQGLRERRAMRRRLGLDHRLPRRPAAGHRRADRRFRHRPASRARHRLGALPAHPHRPRPEGARRHAGRRAQPLPRQIARPAAPRKAARSPNTASTARAFRSANRCRAPATIPAAASPAGSSSARAGRATPTPTSISSPRRRSGRRSAT